MPYTDHYEKYLNEIPEDIEKCKETGDRIVFVKALSDGSGCSSYI